MEIHLSEALVVREPAPGVVHVYRKVTSPSDRRFFCIYGGTWYLYATAELVEPVSWFRRAVQTLAQLCGCVVQGW
jgi:hypothetical protein